MKIFKKFQVFEIKGNKFEEIASGEIDTSKIIYGWQYKVIEAYAKRDILVVVKIGDSYYSSMTTE